MFDTQLRQALAGPLDTAARQLDRVWITPDRLTIAGLFLGLASAVLAAAQWWWLALAAWLLSRLMDGLDGPLSRLRAAAGGRHSPAGGFLDITADFAVYGATVIGVGIGSLQSPASLGGWLPFACVLFTYYLNGAAFLAFSSIAERTGHRIDDGRSFSFLGGLAEGAETIAVHSLWLLIPQHASLIAAGWAGVVAVSAGHRMVIGYLTLRRPED